MMTEKTIRKYMEKVTKIEPCGENRKFYHVGDNFIVETCAVRHDLENPHDMMWLWKKYGYTDKLLQSHVNVQTYYTDPDGRCWGKFNITEKDEGKIRRVINFDYMREATPENERELVAECIRLAVKAKAIA